MVPGCHVPTRIIQIVRAGKVSTSTTNAPDFENKIHRKEEHKFVRKAEWFKHT